MQTYQMVITENLNDIKRNTFITIIDWKPEQRKRCCKVLIMAIQSLFSWPKIKVINTSTVKHSKNNCLLTLLLQLTDSSHLLKPNHHSLKLFFKRKSQKVPNWNLPTLVTPTNVLCGIVHSRSKISFYCFLTFSTNIKWNICKL